MFFREISELGIMVVICGIFLYFAKTIFDYMLRDIKKNYEEIEAKLEHAEQRRNILISGNEKLIEVLNRLENRLRTEKITGKALKTILNTKASQICLCIKNEAIDIINTNNISMNWEAIENETDILISEKMLKFQKDYQELMDMEMYLEIDRNFWKELKSGRDEILEQLSLLRDSKNLTDYRVAIRKTNAVMEKVKKNMQKNISDIIISQS